MQLGVFIPIGNNGWLISTTSPQYKPSFDLNRTIVEKAERFGFDFALSMIKLHGFGGPFGLLGLQSGIVHADGGAGGGNEPDSVVCHLRGADHAAADRRTHGGDDRFDFARTVRGEHHLGLAAARVYPDGHLAGRRSTIGGVTSTARNTSPSCRSLWRTGRSDFKGDFFQMDDCRCLPLPTANIPIICAAQSDAGTRFAAQYADYNFCGSGGINEPTRVAPSVARLVAATEETGRPCGALVLQMIIADETDAAAMAKWEHYDAGTDVEALAYRDEQAEDDPNKDPYSQANKRRTLGVDKLPTNQGVLVGSLCLGRRACWMSWPRCPACSGVMLTFDDFVIGMEQFGTRILPLMRCRNEIMAAA